MADLNKVRFQNEIKMYSNKDNTVNIVLSMVVLWGILIGQRNFTELRLLFYGYNTELFLPFS